MYQDDRLGQLRSFAKQFFDLLGAPIRKIEPDLWQVDLNAEQKAVITPLPTIPWWASPPPPPEPATWHIAFSQEVASAHPQARLLTYNSYLFHQMKEACQRQGRTLIATRPFSRAWGYRPHLALHLRIRRRGHQTEERLEPWTCDLVSGRHWPGASADASELVSGPPPSDSRVERIRLTPEEAWIACMQTISSREEQRDPTWAYTAHETLGKEMAQIKAYYEALSHERREEPTALANEQERRMSEARGRHLPRFSITPVAAALLYLPLDELS